MAVRILAIRHGESEANAGLSREVDCSLSVKGFEQARQVASQLAGDDLSGFIGLTSPYRRAMQTAAEIAKATGLPFTMEEAVREWAGAATINGRHYPVESGEQLAQRLADFLRRHDGRKLVVVSHAAPIAVLIQLAAGEPVSTQGAFWEGVANCRPRWIRTTP